MGYRTPSGVHPLPGFLRSTQTTQADEHDGDRAETAIDIAAVLPADEQPPEVAAPREAAFHFVPTAILLAACDDGASPLGPPLRRAPLGRDAHPHPTPTQCG